jgi:hypothetical protein
MGERLLISREVVIQIPRGWKKLSFHSLIVVEMVELAVIESKNPGERSGSNCACTLLRSVGDFSTSSRVSRCLDKYVRTYILRHR